MRITIKSLVMSFFMNHPNTEFETSTVDDWVNEEYRKAHGKSPRGTSGDIGTLHRAGRLMRVRPGVYKYDPDLDHEGEFEDFSEAVKQAIFRRDGYKSELCPYFGNQNFFPPKISLFYAIKYRCFTPFFCNKPRKCV